jgi:hypothetical protein
MQEKTGTDEKCSRAQKDQAKGDNPPVGMRRHDVFRVSGEPALDQYAGSAQHQSEPRHGAQQLERRSAGCAAMHTYMLCPPHRKIVRFRRVESMPLVTQ